MRSSATPMIPEEPLTIILAEDNPDHAELALVVLERLPGAKRIHLASTGEGVIGYLQKLDPMPDAILLDIKMPLMNGIEVLREMKRNAAWSDIPVVMVSTSANPIDVAACKSLGALTHITKPVCQEELRQAFEKI